MENGGEGNRENEGRMWSGLQSSRQIGSWELTRAVEHEGYSRLRDTILETDMA